MQNFRAVFIMRGSFYKALKCRLIEFCHISFNGKSPVRSWPKFCGGRWPNFYKMYGQNIATKSVLHNDFDKSRRLEVFYMKT